MPTDAGNAQHLGGGGGGRLHGCKTDMSKTSHEEKVKRTEARGAHTNAVHRKLLLGICFHCNKARVRDAPMAAGTEIINDL